MPATCRKSRSLQVPGKTITATRGLALTLISSLFGLCLGAQLPVGSLHHRVGEEAPAHAGDGLLRSGVIGGGEGDAQQLAGSHLVDRVVAQPVEPAGDGLALRIGDAGAQPNVHVGQPAH